MSKYIVAIFVAGMMSGCASPLAMSMAGSAKISGMDGWALCDAYINTNRQAFFDEIKARNRFSDSELAAIRTHSISVGMSDHAARCSWGTHFRVNTSDYGGGQMQQWAYWDSRSYVYVKDHSVMAYQNNN